MTFSITLSAPERFRLIIQTLQRLVAGARPQTHVLFPLLSVISIRLGSAAARFAKLVAHIKSGTVPRHRIRDRAPTPPRTPVPPELCIPQRFGFLREIAEPVGIDVFARGSELEALLGDPEMQAMLLAAPQMARIFRPLLNMTGVRPSPGLLPIAPPQPHRHPRMRRSRLTAARPAVQPPITAAYARPESPVTRPSKPNPDPFLFSVFQR